MSEFGFDAAARDYDQNFTNTAIGKIQRSLVWKQLRKDLRSINPSSILEINCGTGEDARMLTELGYTVTATDASKEMIEIARQKSSVGVEFKVVPFQQLNAEFEPESFDLIFSNFAGLNCVDESELAELNLVFNRLLKPNGHLIIVLLGKHCWIEKMYFQWKGDGIRAKRRLSRSIANIDGVSSQVTICYSVRELAAMFKSFKPKRTRPIGLFVPPSYFEQSMHRLPGLLSFLTLLERSTGWVSGLTDKADHVYLKFQKA